MWTAFVLLAVTGCGRISFDARTDADPSMMVDDAAADALDLGPWGTPSVVVLPTTGDDDDPSMTDDQRELYFNRNGNVIYRSTRALATDPWSTPTVVAEINAAGANTVPEVNGDGLTFHWGSTRSGGLGGIDVFVATRLLRTDIWSSFGNEVGVNSAADDYGGSQTANGLNIIFASNRGGNFDLYEGRRPTTAVGFSPPSVMSWSTLELEHEPVVSPDGLTLYYTGPTLHIFVAQRTDVSQPFPIGASIPEIEAAGFEDRDPWVSADGRLMLFASNRSGMFRLYQTTR